MTQYPNCAGPVVKTIRSALAGCMALILLPALAQAEGSLSTDERLEGLKQRLTISGDAASALAKDPEFANAVTAVVAATISEAKAARSLAEDDSGTIADAIAMVAQVRSEEATAILLDDYVVSTGKIAIDGLARQGARAIPAYLAKLDATSSDAVRIAMLMTLRQMLETGVSLAPGRTDQVERRLVKAARSVNPLVRLAAVRALKEAKSLSSEAKEQLATIMRSDDYTIVASDRQRHLIREVAASALNGR